MEGKPRSIWFDRDVYSAGVHDWIRGADCFGEKLKHRGRWVFIGLLVLGPVYMLLANVSSPLMALPLIIGGGAMFACCTMLTQIMLRTAVPDEMQGSVYGVVGTITSTAPILGLTVVRSLQITGVQPPSWKA